MLIPNDRIVGNKYNVASLHQLEPARQRIALDRCNYGNWRSLDTKKRTVNLFDELGHLLSLRHVSQVCPSAEMISSPFNQDDAGLNFYLANGMLNFKRNCVIQSIQYLRPVQKDVANFPVDPCLECLPLPFHLTLQSLHPSLCSRKRSSPRSRPDIGPISCRFWSIFRCVGNILAITHLSSGSISVEPKQTAAGLRHNRFIILLHSPAEPSKAPIRNHERA